MAPTARQWITRALRKIGDPEEFSRCLQAAEGAADQPSDWVELAEVVVDSGGDTALAHRFLQRAVDEQRSGEIDVATSIRVARGWLKLDEPARGRDALSSARDAVLVRRSRSAVADLCELAEAAASLCGVRADAAQYLDSATGLAKTPGQLAEIASAFYGHVRDAAQARSLLARALTAATEQPIGYPIRGHAWSDIARVQFDVMADAEAARETLHHGVLHADSVVSVLVIAAAWRGHFGRSTGFAEILQAASERAAAAQDYVDIAEAVFDTYNADSFADTGWQAEVRSYLESALAVAKTDSERGVVAAGFRCFLGDAESGGRQLPSGRRPADLLQDEHRLDGWTADASALLDHLRPQMDKARLKAIAESDYGSDYPKHLSALEAIVESGRIPCPLAWHPREVLSLSQWAEGEDHVSRAFACCVLCLDAAGPEYQDATEQTIALGLESCLALGPEALVGWIGLQVAMVESLPDYDSVHLFGLYGLLLAQAAIDRRDGRLDALVERIERVEAEMVSSGYRVPKHGWLLGTTNFDQCHGLWRRLTNRLLAPAAGDPDLDHLTRIANRLGSRINAG